MSIPVRIVEFEHAVHERGSATYVVTVDERGWPHVVQCVQWDRDGLVAEIGDRKRDVRDA